MLRVGGGSIGENNDKGKERLITLRLWIIMWITCVYLVDNHIYGEKNHFLSIGTICCGIQCVQKSNVQNIGKQLACIRNIGNFDGWGICFEPIPSCL